VAQVDDLVSQMGGFALQAPSLLWCKHQSPFQQSALSWGIQSSSNGRAEDILHYLGLFSFGTDNLSGFLKTVIGPAGIGVWGFEGKGIERLSLPETPSAV
jgi:hypothetical protein